MYDILIFIFGGLLVYIGYRFVQKRSDLFTAKAINASIGTLGLLAIFLITIVLFGITLLRSL